MNRIAIFCVAWTLTVAAAPGASAETQGQYTVRAVPLPDGYAYAGANDVNRYGEAAGSAGGQNGTRSLLYANGESALLDSIGGLYTYAEAINDAGQIAGASQSQPWWGYKAVRWEPDGSMTIIDPLTGDENDNCYAFGMNSLGQMVGQSDVSNGMWRAFYWDELTGIIDLGTLGGAYSAANDVNDRGVVVGWSFGQFQIEQAFVWRNGVMAALPSLEESDLPGAVAHAINNRGIIVGDSNGETYGITHAVMWSPDGEIHALGSLGGISSRALDINDAGTIVGEAQVESGEFHAFIYRNGEMQDLNDFLPEGSGWQLEHATGISRDGRIVGLGRLNGESRGFMLEPLSLQRIRVN